MPIRLKRIAPLATMLIFPFLGMLYALVNRPGGRVFSLVTDLDRAIPFIKYFAVPYVVWIFYTYACLVYFYFKDPKVYFRSLATYTISALVCYMIYLVFQTTVPRPVFETGSDPFLKIVAYIYDRDQPFNCFPSIHCFSCYMVMKALFNSGFRGRWNQILIYGMSTLIILSTLFVKQHVIVDAIAGFVLVELVYWGVTRMERIEILNKLSIPAKKPMTGEKQSRSV
jgi:membrane-associated phospholipid phosphatase